MKIRLIISFAFIIIVFCSYGQDTAQLKRSPYKLTIAVDKNTVYEEDINATLYVLPSGTIQLYPGETVYVEVEQENGIIKNMKAVKENLYPAKTLIISFNQTARKKIHQMMMLKITNPFKQKLTYTASIFLMQQKKWVKTNVLPIEAELSVYETWPDVIISIGLGQWSFL